MTPDSFAISPVRFAGEIGNRRKELGHASQHTPSPSLAAHPVMVALTV